MTIRPPAEQPRNEIPLNIVGGNTFGRFSRISNEKTYNMIISDKWLVDDAGYRQVINTTSSGKGRKAYTSSRGGFVIAVIGSSVYRVSGPAHALSYANIFQLDTFYGDVSIDENISYQIAVCDGKDLWIYNWQTGKAMQATLPTNPSGNTIVPGFVTYHDTYFIVADTSSAGAYLSPSGNGLGDWNWGSGGTMPVYIQIQTKPDFCEACLRAPGKGSLVYLFGQNVTEMYNDVGGQLIPYQRNDSVSIDYGCLSSNTIATMDEYVAFLGINEKSGPVILVSKGGGFTHISTDGIDFELAQLVSPASSSAFFTKIAGHVQYRITFYDPADNYTLIYDFSTEKFFYGSDENTNYHIAESVAFYNNTYYFVSFNDNNIYELNPNFTTYDYTNPALGSPKNDFIIPRKRICLNIEQGDSSQFIANSCTFLIDQGNDPYFPSSPMRFLTTEHGLVLSREQNPGYIGSFLSTEKVLNDYAPRIDLSLSKDYGYTFGSPYSKYLNPLGNRKNRVIFWGLGIANGITVQLNFLSRYHVIVSDGVLAAREREETDNGY